MIIFLIMKNKEINVKIFIAIFFNKIMNQLLRFPLTVFDYTMFAMICQEKLFDKIRHYEPIERTLQTMTLVTMPTKSAINDAAKINLVFLIPTLEV